MNFLHVFKVQDSITAQQAQGTVGNRKLADLAGLPLQ